MFSIELLQTELNTKFLGREVKYLDKTNSTNDDAWQYFQNNAVETLVITDNQQKGKGRRQSRWFSVPKKSLTFSFLLIPKIEFKQLSILPLLTGVSIVKGMKSVANIQVGLKWPNDIMLTSKKMGGILIETRSCQSELGIVVGIGLNINESLNDIPKDLTDQTTSLYIYSGENFRRELILSAILNEFECLYLHHWNGIVSLWQNHCIHRNDRVTFHTDDELHKGIFQGITDHGHAEILVNGKIETFPSGIVRLAIRCSALVVKVESLSK